MLKWIKFWWKTRYIRKDLKFQAKQAKEFGKWMDAQDPSKLLED